MRSHRRRLLLAACCLAAAPSTITASPAPVPPPPASPRSPAGESLLSNANHIFNAIHSSMRQWGSSLNHNGMSFFMATVPTGTRFYHGTWSSERVMGMEWLAFEPEHALLFSRPRRPGRHPPGDREPAEMQRQHHGPQQQMAWPHDRDGGDSGMGFGDDETNSSENEMDGDDDGTNSGFLHTYRARRDLRLLYIDGMSAAKTSKGTMDTQDVVLLNTTAEHEMFWDYERGKLLCGLAEQEWGGRVDGILRMEAGFEIILCSFAAVLDVDRITRAGPRYRLSVAEYFDYYRAITDRYHGVGGGRVVLDFDRFVSAFSYPGLDLFHTDAQTGMRLPRLSNLTVAELAMIRTDVWALVSDEDAAEPGTDWQVVADMVVTRYAPRLKHLASLPADDMLVAELERILRPFIDYERRDAELETVRCAAHFLPLGANTGVSLGARAVSAVSRTLCASLVAAAAAASPARAALIVRELIEYLDWTAWKECDRCAADEICLIPIWPTGVFEDWVHPSCTNASELIDKRGYWGDWPPRRDRGVL